MGFREILLAIHFICIIGLYYEIWIVIRRCRTPLHTCLLMSCVTALVNMIGYYLELRADSLETMLSAVKFSYLGRGFYAFFMFLFVSKLARKRIPASVINILMMVHAACYVTILLLPRCRLYYTDMAFVTEGIFPHLNHGDGILHHILMSLQVIYMLIGLFWLIQAYRRQKSKKSRRRVFTILMAIFTDSVFYIAQLIGIPGLTDVYDLTMLGCFISTIFLLIAILSYDLLGTGDLAKDYMIDRISEAIIAVDNEDRIRYFNEPAAALYPQLKAGLLPVGAPGDPITVTHGEEVLSQIKKALDEKSTIQKEDRIFTPEVNDLIDEGENVGRVYALLDETEHFRYMEELKHQRELADSMTTAKSRFLANMSHEIRTPINAVIGMDEMILRESKDKTIRAYASDIMAAGKTLLALINDILDLSKVEEGKMEIIPGRYELSSLIGDLESMIRPRAQKKGLELLVKTDETIPHLLEGDEIRIRQCVMNLLTNAVKYTDRGQIKLRIFQKAEEEGYIGLGFEISDTGIGLKPEDIEKLLNPYERLEEKRNRFVEGTGLGMSITSDLLQLMGSNLEIQSTYGKGSVFSFVIRQKVLSEEPMGTYRGRREDESGESAYRELFRAPDARILVIDDTEMNLTVIKGLLKKTQIVIDTARSGKTGLLLADTNTYDVIMIDHMMPEMDGIEVLEHLKQEGENKETPTIALTANAITGAREMYLEAGFTDYLSKPVDGEKLEKMLRRMLPPEKIQTAGSAMNTGGEISGAARGQNPITDLLTEEELGLTGDAEEIPDWLYEIPTLDVPLAMRHCGSAEGYLSVLRVFHETGATKANEIEAFYREGDLENFTIMVHALKSSARIIGDANLSETAKEMEMAGKRGDTAYIESHIESLLKAYRELDGVLARLDEGSGDLLPIEAKALREAYQTITEIAQSMDYELMEEILQSLRDYRLEGKDEETVLAISHLLTQLDWDGIASKANEALKRTA